MARPRVKCAPEHVLVFDLDDTLYLERDYVLSGLGAVGAWARERLGLVEYGTFLRRKFEAGARTKLFDDCLRDLDIDPTPSLVGRMLAVYRQHRPIIELAPDAADFLTNIAPHIAIGVITDGYLDAQRRKIRALDLYRRGVSLGICTDRWGRAHWKPDRRAFLHMQEYFGLANHCFTYVADNPVKDFIAPKALGWRTIRIVRPGRIDHADHPARHCDAQRVIENLGEL
jgi:putative hydrolase of the HAD superfamily